MQLILNTDTVTGVKKMSTIQQESLDEKFINNSLLEKVCSDIANITNGNEEGVKNLEIVEKEVNEKKKGDQISQRIETLETSLCEKNYEVSKVPDEESSENKEKNYLEIEKCKDINNKKDLLDTNTRGKDNTYNVLDSYNTAIEAINCNELEKSNSDETIVNHTIENKYEILISEKKDKLDKKDKFKIGIEDKIEDVANCKFEELKSITPDKIKEQDKPEKNIEDNLEEDQIEVHNKENCKLVDEMKNKKPDNIEGEIYKPEDQAKLQTVADNNIKEQNYANCGLKDRLETQDKTEEKDKTEFMIEDNIEEQEKMEIDVENKLEDLDEMEIEVNQDDTMSVREDKSYEIGNIAKYNMSNERIENTNMENCIEEQVVSDIEHIEIDNNMEKQHGETIEIQNIYSKDKIHDKITDNKMKDLQREINDIGDINLREEKHDDVDNKAEFHEETRDLENINSQEQKHSIMDNKVKELQGEISPIEVENSQGKKQDEIENNMEHEIVENNIEKQHEKSTHEIITDKEKIGKLTDKGNSTSHEEPKEILPLKVDDTMDVCEENETANNTDGGSNESYEDLKEISPLKVNDSRDVCVENETTADNKKNILDFEVNPKLQEGREINSQCLVNKFKETPQTESAEVIDIADEKDENLETITDQDMEVIEKEPDKNDYGVDNMVSNENIETNTTSDKEGKTTDSEHLEVKSVPNTSDQVKGENLKEITKNLGVEKNIEGKKKLTHISKLSNTLDILSDEEEESSKEESHKSVPSSVNKQCINIEDDDDIMLIDEESNFNDSKNNTEEKTEPTNIVPQNVEKPLKKCEAGVNNKDNMSNRTPSDKQEPIETEVCTANDTTMKTSESNEEVSVPENVIQKPLLPVNFLKTCKKNLSDMTRDELEEFCILKIVESVVDRSNLSDIKLQLKTITQNIEEYRKKASVLAKQNRDLQVVLKSVQEEQRKRSNMPITPLKITRSVGMQVLMNDKSGVRRKPVQTQNLSQNNAASSGPNRSVKGQQNSNSKAQKTPTNTNSPIPVPRLIPAPNHSNINTVSKIQASNTPGKSQATASVANVPITSVPNGLPTTPLQKPEKRSHTRMQQNNSVTVDLTDDEPPAKVIQRNVTPPVRLVSPQNLLASHRQPFGTNINSPRKVYIPISSAHSQGVNVRPGQTIMLKTISPQGPRQRCPVPAAKSNVGPNTVRLRMPNKHPAPLPDSMKQYQPPNWKTLPPAPEIKLSKVENGIVISWKIEGYQEDEYEEIASFQLYAYQETSSPPNTALWKKIGDVKALPLPMACTLTQFMAGYKYYFAVRAVDIRSRLGPFSLPGSILLLNKM